jgi:hypothetical protein
MELLREGRMPDANQAVKPYCGFAKYFYSAALGEGIMKNPLGM